VDTVDTVGERVEEIEQAMQGLSLHACSACGSTDGYKLACTRCKAVWYCNIDCQRADWRKHKVVCRAPAPGGSGV
jgi:hypothetical protein